MSDFPASRSLLLGVLLALTIQSDATAQSGQAPLLQDGPLAWAQPFGGAFPAVKGSALPVGHDPNRAFTPGRSWHIADLSNPNLKEWAKDAMKKDIAEIDAGKLQFSAEASCFPPGVPQFLQSGGPFLLVQARNEVVIVNGAGPVVRHVYLDVPHTKNLKPSWMGESVGRYEGDTLVVDTIGISTKSFVDRFDTPHTDKLHVVERWHLVDQGLTLRVDVTVEDPDTFYQPWKTYQLYRRDDGPLNMEVCAENNINLFNYRIPEASKPDF